MSPTLKIETCITRMVALDWKTFSCECHCLACWLGAELRSHCSNLRNQSHFSNHESQISCLRYLELSSSIPDFDFNHSSVPFSGMVAIFIWKTGCSNSWLSHSSKTESLALQKYSLCIWEALSPAFVFLHDLLSKSLHCPLCHDCSRACAFQHYQPTVLQRAQQSESCIPIS